MTRVVGKGSCDPCCTDWKQKINELWENYQEVIKGIKAGPDTVYPDGNGIADIDNAIENEVTRQISDESLVTTEDLQTAIEDFATISDLNSGLSTLQSAKQDKLVNQVNIKSINGVPVLGSGDMQVSADSVAWDNVTDKPEFAEVATSGSYDDLTDKPTIPAAQVNADWNADSGVAQILNKPTIPAAQVNADWDAASGVAQILNKPTLAAVATSGDYDDLIDKPTIPSGADLVPSTSGITDGYILTNDNGTPAWKAGGSSGGLSAHTYSNWGQLASDIIAHPEGLICNTKIDNAYWWFSVQTTGSSARIVCRYMETDAFGMGMIYISPSDTFTSDIAITTTGVRFNITNQSFTTAAPSATLKLSDIVYYY